MNVATAYNKVPDLKSLFYAASEKFDQLKDRVADEKTLKMSHDAVERMINEEGREVLRELYQAHLVLRGLFVPVEPVIGSDNVTRTHERKETTCTLTSILGDVTVTRPRYEGRGISSLSPVDGDLNLPLEQFSLELRRIAAKTGAKVSFDDTVKHIRETTGATVAKRQVEQLMHRASTDFVPFYAQSVLENSPLETSEVLVLSFDGKGIVMRSDALRESTRKAAEKSQPKLQSRLSKGEKKNRKRMACVAAVYTVAPFQRSPEDIINALWREGPHPLPLRPRPEYKRVWASVERSADEVIDEAFTEAASRDPLKTKRWVVVVDGDPRQIKRIKKVARRRHLQVTIILDLMHALGYLWKAAYVFHPEGSPEAEQWVRERLIRILNGQVGLVAGGISRSATKQGLVQKARKPADDCVRYLLNHKKYMQYDDDLKQGYPICSGVIEGACRHLIRDRLEQTGCRWGLEGAESVLRIRALISSGDFDEYWEFHREQELQRNHLSRYANGRLPALALRRPGSHLRVVK